MFETSEENGIRQDKEIHNKSIFFMNLELISILKEWLNDDKYLPDINKFKGFRLICESSSVRLHGDGLICNFSFIDEKRNIKGFTNKQIAILICKIVDS